MLEMVNDMPGGDYLTSLAFVCRDLEFDSMTFIFQHDRGNRTYVIPQNSSAGLDQRMAVRPI